MSSRAGRVGEGLLPGLPDDLALLCFARLPLRSQALCRCVSRSLRNSLLPTSLQSLKSLHSLPRHSFLFLCLATGDFDEESRMTLDGIEWLLLDPLDHRCDVLPVLPDASAISLQAMPADGAILLHGLSTFDLLDGRDLSRFDVLRWCWSFGEASMIEHDRFEFAWARANNYLYVAGGRCGYLYTEPYKTAERLDLTTGEWEMLPEMNEEREVCSGFVMDGCFYVMGGINQGSSLTSAEVFDPTTGAWTLVPQMWPADIADPEWVREAPTVAVVNEELYALKYMSTQIFWFEKQQRRWVAVGDFPDLWKPAAGHRIVAMGNELWLLRNDHESPISVVSCRPDQGASSVINNWIQLPFDFPQREDEFEKVVACVRVQV